MKLSTKDLILIALFSALTVIGAYLSLPIQPVAISFQTLIVIMSGMILGSKSGGLSQVIYIFLGLIGLPVFTGGIGGIPILMKPSFGFAIGFIPAAYLSGKVVEKFENNSILKYILASLVATLIIYLFGLPYMAYILNGVLHKNLSWIKIFQSGCLIFLPGDIIKCILSSLISYKIIPLIKNNKEF